MSLSCSFCYKRARIIVAGIEACICSECVNLASAMVVEELRQMSRLDGEFEGWLQGEEDLT